MKLELVKDLSKEEKAEVEQAINTLKDKIEELLSKKAKNVTLSDALNTITVKFVENEAHVYYKNELVAKIR